VRKNLHRVQNLILVERPAELAAVDAKVQVQSEHCRVHQRYVGFLLRHVNAVEILVLAARVI